MKQKRFVDIVPMSDFKMPAMSPPPASSSSVATTTDGSSTGTSTPSRGRRERPCDVCRRRKSRCVIPEGSDVCDFCRAHDQESCTFLQDPKPRKKPVPVAPVEGTTFPSSGKKRARASVDPPSPPSTVSNRKDSISVVTEESDSEEEEDDDASVDGEPRKPLHSASHSHGVCLGSTTELESALISLCSFDEYYEYKLPHNSDEAIFRQTSESTTFLLFPRKHREDIESEQANFDAIDRLVSPYKVSLIDLYFRVVHTSFPVILRSQLGDREKSSPLLLAAVLLLSLQWWDHDPNLASKQKPDAAALERLASRLFGYAIQFPQLPTLQAGLLLLQRPNSRSWIMTSQLVALAQELGLHLDSSRWRIPKWERGLRKRLAWAIYMQDKWTALTHGRPSHISHPNWAVKQVSIRDFVEEDNEPIGDAEAEDERYHGHILFTQMIELSQITAEVLDGFFSVERTHGGKAVEDIEHVLERAKPVQIKLKEWYARLPECLRMDSVQNSPFNSNGYLHVGYFATEITLHRAIIRSLNTSKSPYLVHICRTAAKTRLISAMDFVNRLKPEHLHAFWYFASTVSFALIGTFGTLLWATSQAALESEFYKARLDEYRWTLLVSSRGAEFMHFAVRAMDSSAAYCMESVASMADKGATVNSDVLPSFKDMAFRSPLKGDVAVEDEDTRESLYNLMALSNPRDAVTRRGNSSKTSGRSRRREQDEMQVDEDDFATS